MPAQHAPTGSYAVVDAGGTHTRLEVWSAGELVREADLPSMSGAAGGGEAHEVLDEVAAQLGSILGARADRTLPAGPATRGGGPTGATTYVASAAVDDGSADDLAHRLRASLIAHGVPGRAHLFNDVVPLLFSGEPGSETVASINGTGSAVWTRDGGDGVTRVGGVEWLGSDEGSATDLGKRALIAMVRAADGRGPATAITQAAGLDDDAALRLARTLAETAHPKGRIARLARAVTTAWARDRDEVAGEILRSSASDVEDALRVAASRLRAPREATWVFVGGLVVGSPDFQELIRDACARAGAAPDRVQVVENSLHHLREFARAGGVARLPERLVRSVELT